MRRLAAAACILLGATTLHAGGRPVVAGHAFDPFVLLPISEMVSDSVLVGDVTGDKRDDIVVVTGRWNDSPDDNLVLIFRQAADGTLLAPLRYPHNPQQGNSTFGLALGHLNADGVLDIVVGDGGGITILQTSPAGFVSSWMGTGRSYQNVGVLDMDLDGDADIFAQTWSDGATLLYNDGAGRFPIRKDVQTNGYGYNDLKIGDLNGDGTNDVLVTSGQGYKDFSFYPVAPGGSGWLPTVKVPFPDDMQGPSGGAIGDLDGDGIVDLVTSSGGNNDNPYNLPSINLFLGQGGGAYAPPVLLPTYDIPNALATADLDGNGQTDVVVHHAGWGKVGYYLQGIEGLETERLVPMPIASGYRVPHALAPGDVDSNGCPDMVVAEMAGVLVYRGQGCRRSPHDFDLDRRSDILWRNPSTGANVAWKAGNSAKQFDVMDVGNTAWEIVGQGDFDGDARSDLVWRNRSSGANTIWRAGDNTAQIAVVGVNNLAWKIVGTGDFGGDGKADLLWRNTVTGQNVIWHSANAATQTVLATVANFAWEVVGVGDFDGDGKSDLLWRNAANGANQVWRSGDSGTQLPVTGVYNLAWKVQGVGDFDGDGKSDVFWRNTGNGTNTIWRSASSSQQVAVMGVTSQHWRVVAVGDYDADGNSDLLWRNDGNGSNTIWRSGSAATQLPVAGVANLQWRVVP